MKKLGLIGYPLGHSFSALYFSEKFEREGIADQFGYTAYPLREISDLSELIRSEPELIGLNITIPHKISILDYLDDYSEEVKSIGACNTIRIERSGSGGALKPRLIGYNTDAAGFEHSLLKLLDGALLPPALILGEGGAARAAIYVLTKLGCPEIKVLSLSRSSIPHARTVYASDISKHQLIINCTPIGMAGNTEREFRMDFEAITPEHFLMDMVYNPPMTQFLSLGKLYGARIMNGLDMLHAQAEKSWEIWTIK